MIVSFHEAKSTENCIYCMDSMAGKDEVVAHEFQQKSIHHIHKKCLRIWIKHSQNCPLCRNPVDLSSIETPLEKKFRTAKTFMHKHLTEIGAQLRINHLLEFINDTEIMDGLKTGLLVGSSVTSNFGCLCAVSLVNKYTLPSSLEQEFRINSAAAGTFAAFGSLLATAASLGYVYEQNRSIVPKTVKGALICSVPVGISYTAFLAGDIADENSSWLMAISSLAVGTLLAGSTGVITGMVLGRRRYN